MLDSAARWVVRGVGTPHEFTSKNHATNLKATHCIADVMFVEPTHDMPDRWRLPLRRRVQLLHPVAEMRSQRHA